MVLQEAPWPLDYVGREEGSGRRVMGVARRASAWRTALQPGLRWAVPAAWSDLQAASVPHAYATVSTTPRGMLSGFN